RAAAAFVALVSLPSLASAQPAKTGTPGRIEFRAISEDGQTVGDLKPADLSLKVSGKARTIQSLTLYRAASDAPAAAAALLDQRRWRARTRDLPAGRRRLHLAGTRDADQGRRPHADRRTVADR